VDLRQRQYASQADEGFVRANLLILIIFVSIFAGNASAQETRTLTRTVDTVVVPGRDLGARVRGAAIGRLRLFAARAGFPSQILYQFDERNRAGSYCYDQGPTDKRVRDEDRGLLDDNDELVFLARDAADRLPQDRWPLIAGQTAVQELELRDPKTGGVAWVYLARFDGPMVPQAPTGSLVQLTCRNHDDDEKTYTWRGERFVFDNDRSRLNAVRATYASFVEGSGQAERRGPNVLDSTIVRAVVSFMWVEVVRQSNDIRVEIGAWRAGPIRVIAQNCLQVYLALGMWASAPDSYIILWPNKVSMPTNARCPVNLDQSGESSYTLCMDMTREARGWKFYNSHNATPIDVDGRTGAGERALDMTFPDWNCVFGQHGAIISKFVIPPALQRATNRLVFVDDEYYQRQEDEEGIEFERGAFGTNGYYVDMKGLQEGTYPGDYVVWYAGAPFVQGDHQKYLDEWDHPVTVTAR
jgi:hypothetical protein